MILMLIVVILVMIDELSASKLIYFISLTNAIDVINPTNLDPHDNMRSTSYTESFILFEL